MNYYIATGLDNHAAHNALRDELARRGHRCTYDWTEHGPVWSSGLARVEQVAMLEHEGVAVADTVIVLWPGGRGTHVELGMALALEKHIVFITGVEGHHTASPEVCAFYHHPGVELYHTVAEWLDDLARTRPLPLAEVKEVKA